MTDYKILGQSAPSEDVETDLYTVPDSKSTVVRAINVTNTASASDTFDIALIDDIFVEVPTFLITKRSSQTAAISTNGIVWTSRTGLPAGDWAFALSYGKRLFVAASFNSPLAMYSTDTIVWNTSTMPSGQWRSMVYANDKFVAIAQFSATGAISTNGITWTATTMPSSPQWQSLTYGNNIFVAIAQNSNTTAYSTDGISWTPRTLPSSAMWDTVAFGDGKFVVGSSNSTKSAYSTDGITWVATSFPSSSQWKVAYGNNIFVAVPGGFGGAGISSAVSTNGITWTATTMPSNEYWLVGYGNGIFVAIASFNTTAAAVSTDGITWTSGTLPTTNSWSSPTFGIVFSLQYSSTTDKEYIFKSHEILGNETITIKGGHTLDSNNKIRIKSTNGTSTFHAFGGEI